MTGLGEFLERFYGPEEYFRTVQARVRHTTSASSDSLSVAGRPSIGRRRRGAKPRSEATKDFSFWAHLPDKVRVETACEREGRSETTVEVVNGDTGWVRRADGTVEQGSGRGRRTSEKCSLPTPFQRHFDRGLLRQCFAALTLELTGNCHVAGYDCLTIRARHVPGTQLWPHWLSFHANEFEFAGEVEHAVLLSIKGIVGDVIVEAYEVLDVTFDGNIDDSFFVYEPEASERIQAAIPPTEHITLEAAAARAPFVVLQPGYIPNPQQTHSEVMYHTERSFRKVESLTIFYRGGSSYEKLWLLQSCEPDESQQLQVEWDELLVDGHRLEISDPHPEEGLRVLSYRLENTFVAIVSDLLTDELVKIALSLRPVREQDGQV